MADDVPTLTDEQISDSQSMGEMVGEVALIGGQIAAVIELASAPGKKAGQKLGQVST
ncbi:MAG: hypothetical protein QNJ44_22810 [Rhodobacter sp.]|nr:hypothetical protein [Rhodobacter sp.]